MRVILDVAGIVLLLQGFGPLVQEAVGTDSSQSLFVTNQVPGLMPWAGLVIGVGGVALLFAGRRARRRSQA
jgi:hypothetical protein